MKIATFNINNVQRRLPVLLAWLKQAKPDIVCLQELKAAHEAFPGTAIEGAGYHFVHRGEKTWNGVAILARGARPVLTRMELPGDPNDRQSRYIEAAVKGILVASIYLPNGNPQPGPKFAYKLAWFDRLIKHAASLKRSKQPVILAGDYNVIPEPIDCHDPKAWADDALFQPESRRAFRALLHQGLTDAFRALHPDQARAYTFWDYQRGAFQLDHGIRIDHLLLSAMAADRVTACVIDKEPRRRPRASDHTPVIVTLEDRP